MLWEFILDSTTTTSAPSLVAQIAGHDRFPQGLIASGFGGGRGVELQAQNVHVQTDYRQETKLARIWLDLLGRISSGVLFTAL